MYSLKVGIKIFFFNLLISVDFTFNNSDSCSWIQDSTGYLYILDEIPTIIFAGKTYAIQFNLFSNCPAVTRTDKNFDIKSKNDHVKFSLETQNFAFFVKFLTEMLGPANLENNSNPSVDLIETFQRKKLDPEELNMSKLMQAEKSAKQIESNAEFFNVYVKSIMKKTSFKILKSRINNLL
jgi:hypothetical protein